MKREKISIVVVDDDRDIAEIVQTILIDEGFKVSCLYEPTTSDVKAAIDLLEPDCVLLDGGHPASYGPSWDIAAWLASRPRPIPAVMMTGHPADRDEATVNESGRAKAAQVSGVLAKPFDIDHLIRAVSQAVGLDVTAATDREEADNQRLLLDGLRAAGAEELTGSEIGRVWATFRTSDGSLYKVYRWRAFGVYFVGRYSAGGAQMAPLGQFTDLDALVAYCRGRVRYSRAQHSSGA